MHKRIFERAFSARRKYFKRFLPYYKIKERIPNEQDC